MRPPIFFSHKAIWGTDLQAVTAKVWHAVGMASAAGGHAALTAGDEQHRESGAQRPSSAAARPSGLVDAAIAQLLPSADPLDDPNFDVTAMLNKHFPSEMSLAAVESHCDRLALKMHSLDLQILQAVEQQSSSGSAVQQALNLTKASGARLEDGGTCRSVVDHPK